MKVADVLVILEVSGSGQWGLITTAQAAAAGVPRIWLSRLTSKGILRKIRQGAYALPSAVHHENLDLRAAWLLTNPGVKVNQRLREKKQIVVSHSSAASLQGLIDYRSDIFTFTCSERKQTGQKDFIYHLADLPAEDVQHINGLPVTSLERTLVDLAETIVDQQEYAEILRRGIEKRRVNIRVLQTRLYKAARMQGFANGVEYYKYLTQLAPHQDATEALADVLPKYANIDLKNLTGYQGRDLAKLLGLDEIVQEAVGEYLGREIAPTILSDAKTESAQK